MGWNGGASVGHVQCWSVVVYHPDRILAEAIAATLRTTGVAGDTSAADRVDELLRFRRVPALLVMASAHDGEVADVAEALAHRRVTIPLMTCHDTIPAARVLQDLLDGASGVADLTSSPRRFAAVARTVADGGLTIPVNVRPCVLRAVVRAAAEHAQARDRLARMTPRQRQVLGLMAMGHGHSGVAARLGLSVTTARTHADQVRAKLDAASQLEAAIEARRTLRLGTAPARPVEALFDVVGALPGDRVSRR
jgi:two-component system nitrate/nitrite response regulator NarL